MEPEHLLNFEIRIREQLGGLLAIGEERKKSFFLDIGLISRVGQLLWVAKFDETRLSQDMHQLEPRLGAYKPHRSASF